MCTVLVHLLHVKYCMNIHYLPCNIETKLRLEMVTKKTVFRVYACQWLGPSTIEKLYDKMVLCYII